MKKWIALAMVFMLAFTIAGSIRPMDKVDRDRFKDIVPNTWTPTEADPWWETTTMDQDGNQIFDTLDNSELEIQHVHLDYDHTPTEQDLLLLKNFEVSWVFDSLNVVSLLNVHKRDLSFLTSLPGVVMIEPWGTPELYSDIATPNSKAAPSEEYSPESAWELGYSGKGASIAVVDTGVDNNHPGLIGKWLGGVDLSKPEIPFLNPWDGSKDADDTNGHGTTCTGIAMGTGAPEGKYKGAAPDAKVVDVRIGTVIGYAPGELIQHQYDASLMGITWSIDHMEQDWPGSGDYRGIDIVSLSWGLDVGGNSDGSDVYSRALDNAVGSGLIVVNAAGNDGPDNVGFQGFAASSLSIKIAASDDLDTITRDDDEIAFYSCRGPRKDNGDSNPYNELIPDVAAPGTGITQCQFDRTGDASNNGYGNRGSGTSYATPNVAGIVGMMLEANGELDNGQVREILRFTAERKGEPTMPDIDPFWNRDFGWGLVDAWAACKMAERTNAATFDPDLQCFITNIVNTTNGKTVEGMAWAKTKAVAEIEVLVDGTVVRTLPMNGTGRLNWSVSINNDEIGSGNHTIGARASLNDGYSLPFDQEITVKYSAHKEPFQFIPLIAIIVIIGILGAALAVFYLVKRKK